MTDELHPSIAGSMPDPNSNVQLGEGAVPAASLLGGDVSTQFMFGKPEDFVDSVEVCRLEQEAICGYPLKVKNLRQTHMQDEKGRDVYEVFATFEPAPVAPPVPGDATQ